jgi:hypothetical protein
METYYPDDVMPSQWMDQNRAALTDVPERRLMIALLFDVIRVLHGGGVKQRAEISAWIRGTNAARIPFRLLCEALEIEPTCLARRLLRGEITRASRFRAHGDKRKGMPSTPENFEVDPAAALG